MKNVEKHHSIGLFNVLKHRLNVYQRPRFLEHGRTYSCSLMIFHLDERYNVRVMALKSGKKSLNWVSVGNFETLRIPLI